MRFHCFHTKNGRTFFYMGEFVGIGVLGIGGLVGMGAFDV
jgi:hypothetical protein